MLFPLRVLCVLLLSLCASLAAAGQPPAPVDVTTCGQVVSGAGRLAADLDCSGSVDLPLNAAIVIGNHGSLDLDGHTLRGGTGLNAVMCGSACERGYCATDCTVSNGTIGIPTYTGLAGRNVKLQSVTINANTWGVIAFRKLTIMDSTIGGADYVEVQGRWIKIYRSTLIGSGLAGISTGPRASSLKLFDTTVSGHGCDLSTWRLPRLHDSTCASSCGDGPGGSQTWGVCSND